MATLAQLILTHRKKAGLTQPQLAKFAGVGKTVVWDLEHGKESVQWDTLQKILRVLNITVEWRSPLLQRIDASAKTAPSASISPIPSNLPAPAPASLESRRPYSS